MADTVIEWDSVVVSEKVTAADIKKAEQLSAQNPVGLFLCDVVDVTPLEKNLKEYSCVAAQLKLRVKRVLEIEKPVFDDAGKAVVRNGEPLMKVSPVLDPKEKEELDNLHGGLLMTDEVNFYNEKEKERMKNRRLFVARKIGILDEHSCELNGQMWRNAKGKEVIVRTEWNGWVDKVTKEAKKNVKVAFDGYESAATLTEAKTQTTSKVDYSGI